MKILPYKHTALVNGAGDVLIDYFVSLDDMDGSDEKCLSVLIQFTGKPDEIMECVNTIFV